MNNRILSILVLILIAFNCNAQNKIDSIHTSQENKIKLLNSKLKLTDTQIKKIIDNDSIMGQVTMALKDSIVHNSIRKSIDSFVLGKYTTKETYVLIRLQLRYKNVTVELARGEGGNFPNKSIEEFEKYYDKVDSLLSKEIKMKRDTIIYKKHQ